LLATLLMIVAMPWNLTLWWMAHRLRLAVEVDCDERVLRGGLWDVRTYGALLLFVGRRRSRPAYSLAAFSRPRSSLEHRILEMTRPAGRARWARSGAVLVAVLALALTSFALPAPNTLAHWTDTGYWCGLSEAPLHVYHGEGDRG
jgi:beta-lactamase regulating signal transducer with metallopeptidase domain